MQFGDKLVVLMIRNEQTKSKKWSVWKISEYMNRNIYFLLIFQVIWSMCIFCQRFYIFMEEAENLHEEIIR